MNDEFATVLDIVLVDWPTRHANGFIEGCFRCGRPVEVLIGDLAVGACIQHLQPDLFCLYCVEHLRPDLLGAIR